LNSSLEENEMIKNKPNMDHATPKTRKGQNGRKKDQKQKGAQEHRLGNSKFARMMEERIAKKMKND